MADKQVVRQDVVEITWEIQEGPLKDLIQMMKDFKKVGKDAQQSVQKGWKSVVNGAKSVKSTLTPLNNKLNNLGNSVLNVGKKFSTGIGRIAKKAVLGLTAALAAAGAGLLKCVNMASDLQESTSKVEVSFGSDSGQVMSWSKSSIKDMGLAQQTALDAAALFGDMGTSMGLSTKEAANMSTSLVQLGADLSSFKNISSDQSMTALKSIFTGETETLKNLGIVMTQTNLEAFALSKGIKKEVKDMTEAEKVQLRYAYVMEKSKNAQGDFVRTGGNWANQARMLGEQFKQLGASIGGLKLEKLTAGLRVVNGWMTRINEILADGWQEGDKEKLFAVFTEAGTTIKNKLMELAPIVGSAVSGLVLKAKEYLIANKGAIWEGFKEVMAQGINFIAQLFTGEGVDMEAIKTKIEDIKNKAVELVNAFKENWPAIKTAIIGVVIAVGLLKGAMLICNTIIAINNAIMTAKQAIDLATAAKAKILAASQWLVNTSIMGCPVIWLIAAFVALIAIVILVVKHWDTIKAAILRTWAAFQSFLDKLGPFGQEIKARISDTVEGIKQVWGGIKQIFQGIIDFVVGVFTGDWQRAWEGVKNIFGGIWESLKGLAKAPLNAVIRLVNKAIGGLNSISVNIPDWVPGFGGKTFGINIPKIPELAKGGVLKRGQVGLLEGNGAEAVVPLEKNTGWIKAVASALRASGTEPTNYPRNNYKPSTGAPTSRQSYSENNTYAPSFTLNFTGTTDRTAERVIKQWVKESMEEMFDSMGRTNPRLTEV